MRRKMRLRIQRRLGAVFIWRWLLSAMRLEDCRPIFLKAKLNFLFFHEWNSFPCLWHLFVFLQCLGDAFYPVTGCLEWPCYLRLPLPLPIFSFHFVLLIALLLNSHSLLFHPCLFLIPSPLYHSLLPCWQLLYGKKEKVFGVSKKNQNKPDPGNLSTTEQTGFSTVVLPVFLKSYNRFFSAWLRFSLSWAGSRGCASFVLMQYLSMWGRGSLWVGSVGFYCHVCSYSN